jgi:transcriptional regulator with AAA-type ATPase domain/tetratricopeptide (TPR) repeat protein
VEAVIEYCEELVFAGEARVALELLERSQRHVSTLPRETILQMGVARVQALVAAGLYSESLDVVRSLMLEHAASLEKLPEAANELQIFEGTSLWMLNKPDDAIRRLSQVRSRLLTQADSHLLASCSIQLSAAYYVVGDYEASRRLALDALVSARRSGHKYFEGQALTNYCRLERQLCRWADATEAAEESLRIHESLGNRHQSNHARRGLALIHLKRGRLDGALRLTDVCIAEAAAISHAVLHSLARLLKALILVHQGRYPGAGELLESFPGWGGLHAESRASLLASEFLGDVFLEQGLADSAMNQYAQTFPKALALVPKGDIVAELRRRRAECYYLLGRVEEAYAEAKDGLEHCRELGDRYEEAATYRVLALSAAANGKPDEAKKWFDQGFAYYDDIETPYEWGKLWMAYGDWLLGPHAGAYADRKGALEAYYAARDHFERMGAEAKLAEVSTKLEKLAEPQQAGSSSPVGTSDAGVAGTRPTPRRPRRSTELDRRSAWAAEAVGIITRNKALLALLDDVAKLAPSEAPILVLGESGTGKELVARGIHALSGRKGPFMAINAGSLPREIIESELFGHVVGAFTGATRDKAGMFEVCDQGTVFLDEIAEMPVDLQSRLLRFLETGESRRVGANGNIAVDTRIIAATNRERGALERGESFRLDLYYRLAHAVIALPPLRQRGDDIELLASHFLDEACAAAGRQVHLSPAALRRLTSYSWPGNVRQLRAVLKRVVLLSADGHEVTPEALQLENAEVPTTLIEELEQAERRRVREALAQARGSRTDAAQILGMPRTTFINKLRRYGLK